MSFKRSVCAVLSAVLLAPAVPVPASQDAYAAGDAEDTAYLFAYFRDDPDRGTIEELCYGVSRDGYNFRALNGGETVFTSDLGTEHLRDPFIFEGEDGYFYIVVTDMNSSLGWASQSTIAIYKTPDLINMEDSILVDYKAFEGFEDCNRAWAPQVIWCPEHENEDGSIGAYMIYLTLQKASTSGSVGSVMYKQFATDLMDESTYTDPEFMITGSEDGGFRSEGAIDGDIIYDEINDRWLMYFDGRRIAVSDTVDGTYTELEEPYNKAHSATRLEGSNMYKLLDKDSGGEDKWIFCADGSAFGTGFCVSVTTDFENYTDLKRDVDFTYDFTPRHGYVVTITEDQLNALFDEYGYVDLPDQFSDNPLDWLKLPYTDNGYMITGNITLPDSIDGFDGEVTWSSSNEDVISTEEREFTEEEKAEYGANYVSVPAGVVTRQSEDVEVTLTAYITEDGEQYTKEYPVRVKAKPEKSYAEMDADGDFTGYLYASFIEPAVSRDYQQTFFAISDDGLNWSDLNDNRAVLKSTMGTGGLRDHYIIRSPEGDKFYLLATDLDCTSGDWTSFAENGSKSIMVWESDDLVNWSKQRMVRIADDNTGCAWAPEAIYDELTGEYIVYWSGTDMNEDSDSYKLKVVYYSKTRDFYSFTPQQQFVYPTETDGAEGTNTSRCFIDSTMIQGSDGLFYRATKYEDTKPLHVFVDVAEYPLGEFKRVDTNLEENDFLGTEGPGWFKFNKDDAERTGNKYCLMLDGFQSPNGGVGFFPSTIEDLNNDWDTIDDARLEFTRVKENYKMRSYAKHGGILPITQEEYDALIEAYPPSESTDLSGYINEDNKVFDISDTYPDYPSGWTLPSEVTLDDNMYHYLGINGELVMGDGYCAGSDWAAIHFDMAANSDGDNIIRDIDGNAIIGYCYAPGGDGLWIGHGERSFGGTKTDSYGVRRLPNYLKTEVADGSHRTDTGQRSYMQHELCTIIMKNQNGTVDSYSGDYYTVETYINGILISTEYYSGHFNGIGSIESNRKQYFGSLCLYSGESGEDPEEPTETTGPIDPSDPDTDNEHLLFALNFDDETTNAQKGKATAYGNIEYADGSNGTKAAVFDGSTSYISAEKSDGTPLLRGTDEAVIILKAKLEKPSTTNGWYFYTSWNDSPQENRRRSYTGIYSSGSDGKTIAERFRDNSGTPTITADTSFDKWYDITYIIDGYTAELYIDGVFAGSADYEQSGEDHTLSTILGSGDAIVTYFGKANWGTGEYAKGMFDDIAVYDFAPGIQLGDLNNVKTDIDLPAASEETDGYTIIWESSDPDTITSDGKVTRPETGKKNVTLTATITFDNKVLTRTFDAVVKGEDYYDMVMNVSDEKGVDIQDNMYGLFFEDINYAADGGLYAELVENRSFEQESTTTRDGKATAPNPGYAWSAVSGTMEYKQDTPLNENNPTYLEFTGTSFKNQAYQGMNIEAGKEYKVSFWARSSGYTGTVSAKAQKDSAVAFSGVIAQGLTNEWKKYEAVLTAEESVRYSELIIELSSEGTVDFDMISVMPNDALYGVFRTDLAERLKALDPGFLRFPGGCVVEGYDLSDRYQWKNSVGPVEERVQNWNRWAADTDYPNYNQTLGLGFYEYFLLCEYLECDPLPVLSVGIPCEYQGGRYGDGVPVYNDDGSYTDEFYQYIDDAIDLIEFANGGTDTEWGSLRASMGHEEPFGLTMIGIGNEQWAIEGNDWYERYEAFEKEIHKVYPDIKLISTSGPSASGSLFDEAWSWIRENQAENSNFTYAVDEHYYMSPQWFLENDTRYDDYDRGTKVFAGEYAAHTTLTNDTLRKNNLESAIAEAAYMTGLERNADVVYMASYAPLFARIGYAQWTPDLIWFDDASSYVTPNYYVQSMYSNNNGDYTLKSSVSSDEKVYQTVSYDNESGDIIIKLVNPYEYEQRTMISVDDSFALTGNAVQTVLTGENWTDANSMEEPDTIAPKTADIAFENGGDFAVPAKSFLVLRIHTSNDRLVMMKSFEANAGSISYELETSESFDGNAYDIYTAVYDEDGTLVKLLVNQLSGTVETDPDKSYDVKVMVWKKDTMEPAMTVIKESTLDNSPYKLMSYTTDGGEYYGTWTGETDAIIGNSLHLAVSSDGGDSYDPLNYNTGVLYAEADYSEEGGNPYRGAGKMLRDPYVFKTETGYGVIAARADEVSDQDTSDGEVMIYTSDDLTDYEFAGYLKVDTDAVYEPACVYENGEYTVTWSDRDGGVRKYAVTKDLRTIDDTGTSSEVYTKPSVDIDHATEATNVLNISKTEYEKLISLLNAPVNTGVRPFDDITVSAGENAVLPEKATAVYNDGSTQEYNVEWDTSALNTSVPGEYTVNGTVQTKDYDSELIPDRADPCMLYFDGKYYFVATRDSGGQYVLNIRVADTIEGLADAADNLLFDAGGELVWAPEIHEVDGKLMIFFAWGRKWDRVQSHVMVLEGDDPTAADDWSSPVRITKQDGQTFLIDNGISLDMTCFEWEGKYYLAWAQRQVSTSGDYDYNKYGYESSNIYIAEYDPDEPGKLAGEVSVISYPSYGWERTTAEVDEGPFVLEHDGRLYMTVAANGTNWSYGIKLLTLKEGGDPLDPSDWEKKGYPLLSTAMNNSEPGPGHSSFTVDENGDPVLVYHWGETGGGRTTTVKNVHFNKEGEPVLNIPRGEQVLDEYKNVTVKVIVE